eukprot:gene11330-13872_t
MLKIGICSSVKISNSGSSSYHSPSASNISRARSDGTDGIQILSASTQAAVGSPQTSIELQAPSITLSAAAAISSSDSVNSTISIGSGSSIGMMVGGSGGGGGGNSGGNSSGGMSQGSSQSGSGVFINGSSDHHNGTGGGSSNGYVGGSGGNGGIGSNGIQNYQSTFNCLTFHTTSNIIYAAIRNEIYFYDLLTQSVVGKLLIDSNETVNHLMILVHNNMRLLLAFTDIGLLYLWDSDTHKLLNIVHQLKAFDVRPITCKVSAPNRPLVFFSKSNSKDIVVVDFHNKGTMQYKLKGHKKPISSLAHHPSKPILASCSNDGSLKIWEYTRSQMPALNLEDFSSHESSRYIEHSNNFFLSFEPTVGKYMIMTGSSGLTLVYGDLTQNPQDIIANGFVCKGHTILSLVHHPHLPVFFILSINQNGVEELSSWEINYQMKSISPSSIIPTFIPDTNNSLNYLSKYSKPLIIPRLLPTGIIIHPTKNYLTFQWEANASTIQQLQQLQQQNINNSFSSIRHINQFIYSINSYDHLNNSFPLVSTVPLPMGFFFQPENTFNYPAEIMFFDGTFVKSYMPLNGVTKKLIDQPIILSNSDEICRSKKFLYNTEYQLFTLIYDFYSPTNQALLSKYLVMDIGGSINQQGDGIDAVLIGSSQILVLGFDGKLAKVASITNQGISAFKNHTLSPKVTSVHQTPLADGKVVLYFSQEKHCILFSKNINPNENRDNYGVDTTCQYGRLHLFNNEKVFKVEWQSDPKSSQHICAILTDMRIIITNSKLNVINQISVPPSHKANSAYFQSIFWVEWTLLYTTSTHLMYMTLQNNLQPRPISSLCISPIVLSTVLPDRIIFGYQGQQVPGKIETSIRAQSIGLLEPLIIGILSLPSFINYDKKYIATFLQNIVSKFDYSRISKFVLDKLKEKSFTDLAYSLSNQMKICQSKLSSLEKFRLAWSSKQYVEANKHLTEEYNRLTQSGSNKSSSESEKRLATKLKENMRDFGRECMNAGHYQLARECFTKLGEYVYLLQISILLNDRDAIIALKKEAEAKGETVLIASCEKFLNKKPVQHKVNPPVIKILPWQPTPNINLSIKVGNDYLSPINLNSIQRYFPITGAFSGAAPSLNGTRHKLRAPDEHWPPEDYKHSVALSPPRTLMSLVANKLSTKSHISSTQTLRRSPSAENMTKLKDFPFKGVGGTGASQDYDEDSGSDSESGADADVDSETEEDLLIVSKTIENQLKEIQVDPEESSESIEPNDSTDIQTEPESDVSVVSTTPSTSSTISNVTTPQFEQ